MAVVVTRLTVNSSAGRAYSRHREGCAEDIRQDGREADWGWRCESFRGNPGPGGEAWGCRDLSIGQDAPVSGCTGIQGVKLFARLEANGLARRDADFRSGPGVAANARLAGPDAEDAEAAQFNAVAGCQSLFEALKDGVHGGFRFGAGQPGALNDVMNDILLDQCVYPICEEIFGAEETIPCPAARRTVEQPTGAMLLRVDAVVNLRSLQYDKQLRALLPDRRNGFRRWP